PRERLPRALRGGGHAWPGRALRARGVGRGVPRLPHELVPAPGPARRARARAEGLAGPLAGLRGAGGQADRAQGRTPTRARLISGRRITARAPGPVQWAVRCPYWRSGWP